MVQTLKGEWDSHKPLFIMDENKWVMTHNGGVTYARVGMPYLCKIRGTGTLPYVWVTDTEETDGVKKAYLCFPRESQLEEWDWDDAMELAELIVKKQLNRHNEKDWEEVEDALVTRRMRAIYLTVREKDNQGWTESDEEEPSPPSPYVSSGSDDDTIIIAGPVNDPETGEVPTLHELFCEEVMKPKEPKEGTEEKGKEGEEKRADDNNKMWCGNKDDWGNDDDDDDEMMAEIAEKVERHM